VSEDFFIRSFKSSDFNQVMNLWMETGLGNPERGDDLVVVERTLKLGGAFWVLEHKPTHQVIGTSWITNDGRRLYLHHFGIKPEFQGMHLATSLLETSLAFAKETGLQIKLEVHQQNKKAIELYQKAGFINLGDYGVFIIRNYQ
jgi:ribosomal protein S18 acetylase RimI-like enzyme